MRFRHDANVGDGRTVGRRLEGRGRMNVMAAGVATASDPGWSGLSDTRVLGPAAAAFVSAIVGGGVKLLNGHLDRRANRPSPPNDRHGYLLQHSYRHIATPPKRRWTKVVMTVSTVVAVVFSGLAIANFLSHRDIDPEPPLPYLSAATIEAFAPALEDGLCPAATDGGRGGVENSNPPIWPVAGGTPLMIGIGQTDPEVQVQVCVDVNGLMYYFGRSTEGAIVSEINRVGAGFHTRDDWWFEVTCDGSVPTLLRARGQTGILTTELTGGCVPI